MAGAPPKQMNIRKSSKGEEGGDSEVASRPFNDRAAANSKEDLGILVVG